MRLSSLEPQGRRRANPVAVAVVASLLVHALAVLLFGLTTKVVALVPQPRPRPTETPQFVTTSESLHLEKRAVPVPHPPARKAAPPPAPRKQIARQPVPVPNRRPPSPEPTPQEPSPSPLPTLPEPSVVKEVLSRARPSAEPKPTPAPTRPPQARPSADPGRVAIAPQPPAPQSKEALRKQQLAMLEQRLAQTIAEARNRVDPLRVPHVPPAAPKHYKIQFQGAIGTLHGGEGTYEPVQAGWSYHGLDCYYMSYQFMWMDDTLENGLVPWPVCFPPRGDPFAHGAGDSLRHTPLPPPPADWVLKDPATLGKALRDYFPNVQFPPG